jgi:hypothetical protein
MSLRASIVLIDRTFGDSAIDRRERAWRSRASELEEFRVGRVYQGTRGKPPLCWNVGTRRMKEGGFVALRSY